MRAAVASRSLRMAMAMAARAKNARVRFAERANL